jgi:hypothetical protein
MLVLDGKDVKMQISAHRLDRSAKSLAEAM